MKIRVIINAQHEIMEDQVRAIKEYWAGKEVNIVLEKIPAEGLVLAEIEKLSKKLFEGRETEEIVIASPIPALMSTLASEGTDFFVLHNDKREKKELPNGKIIMTVVRGGWVIV